MKLRIFISTMLFIVSVQGYAEDKKPQPLDKFNGNSNPRLSDPNPNAWEGLPMKVVISDLQQSDGIFSSFICDELNKRLSKDPSGSLRELNSIDKKSRTYAFKICLSPEAEDSTMVLNSIRKYSSNYPELVKEITGATK